MVSYVQKKEPVISLFMVHKGSATQNTRLIVPGSIKTPPRPPVRPSTSLHRTFALLQFHPDTFSPKHWSKAED